MTGKELVIGFMNGDDNVITQYIIENTCPYELGLSTRKCDEVCNKCWKQALEKEYKDD